MSENILYNLFNQLIRYHLRELHNYDLQILALLFLKLTRCFREAYTGLPVVRATENQKALNCVVLKYSIPVSEE